MKVRMRELTPNLMNCRDCLYCDTCPKDKPCEYFVPVEGDTYIDQLLERLRETHFPSYIDNARDDYETIKVDKCLQDIRLGHIGYVNSESAVAEIFNYEPKINVVYEDGIFYITL